MRIFKNSGGMTLAEVVVSMALMAIAAVIMSSAIASSQALIIRGIQTERNAAAAFSSAERSENISGGSVTFSAGGENFTVAGSYSRGESNGVYMTAFDPGGGTS